MFRYVRERIRRQKLIVNIIGPYILPLKKGKQCVIKKELQDRQAVLNFMIILARKHLLQERTRDKACFIYLFIFGVGGSPTKLFTVVLIQFAIRLNLLCYLVLISTHSHHVSLTFQSFSGCAVIKIFLQRNTDIKIYENRVSFWQYYKNKSNTAL